MTSHPILSRLRIVNFLTVRRGVSHKVLSFPTVIASLLVLKVVYLIRDSVMDPDLFWHLRNAAYLVGHHRLPDTDMYSFTATGAPWLNHQWLSELPYYAGYKMLGYQGVVLMLVLVLCAISVGTFIVCRREGADAVAAGLASMFGSALMAVGYTARTQHFAWLCFLAIFAILLQYRSRRHGPLWLIPVLFCLWINCHGSWLFGLAVCGIYVVAGLLPRDLGTLKANPWSARDRKRLFLSGLASLGALFVNPYGYRLVWYPFDMMFRQRIVTTAIDEWIPVHVGTINGNLMFVAVVVIFLTSFVSRRPWQIADAVLAMFVLYAGFAHQRFLLPAGIALPILVGPHLPRFSSYNATSERRLLNGVCLTSVIALIIAIFPSAARISTGIAKQYPAGAVAYLRTHPTDGRILNQYDWGGYLEWELPQTRTFIDGRADIFAYNGTFADYLDLTRNGNLGILAKYHIGSVLIGRGTPLSIALSKTQSWKEVFADGESVIYGQISE